MKILHISAECYPAAKAGGLGDVAGALPKYLNQLGMDTAVVIPKYRSKWIEQQSWKPVYGGQLRLYQQFLRFTVHQLEADETVLGFPLYAVDIVGLYDREGVYLDIETGQAYTDETERALCFQIAVLLWVKHMKNRPSLLHCHDHHTGLIPFMVKHVHQFKSLSEIPTVFTIHNGEYQGAFSWRESYLLPFFDTDARGLLDWDDDISPLAAAIKCAWKVTTVSEGYLEELHQKSGTLTWLYNQERSKAKGIINGIDTQVWNPKTDKFIAKKYTRSPEAYKKANKKAVLEHFHLEADRPLITFIGRLVGEKGAQLLPQLIRNYIQSGGNACFAILGTGELNLHHAFGYLKSEFEGRFDVKLEYNEALAHQLYAGSDFLLMPSKVEPCGLNQMYALRYGTIPIVRSVGGLKDTIRDISLDDGNGIRFDQFAVYDAFTAVERASLLFEDQKSFKAIRKRIMQEDFSWERSAGKYKALYEELLP